jgi:hypothetical protein
MLHLGIGFLVLLITAAYTANLATFLIQESSKISPLASIDEASARRSSICVNIDSSAQGILTTYYPRVVQVPVRDSAIALSSGLCQGAILSNADFELSAQMKLTNPNCNLEEVGKPFRVFDAGFVYYEDYNNYCTSFLASALNVHLLNLRATGELDQLWQNNLLAMSDLTCTETPVASLSLDINNMAGVFVIYAIFIGGALCIHFSEYVYDRNQLEQDKELPPVPVAANADDIKREQLCDDDFANEKKVFTTAEADTNGEVVRDSDVCV